MILGSEEVPVKFHTKLKCQCDACGTHYLRRNHIHKRMQKNPICDMDYCYKCWQAKLHTRPEYIAKMKRANKGINQGNKNGMKQAQARGKVSKARRKMFQDPNIRKHYSDKSKEAWARGDFDGVKTGQCKWHIYRHSNGEEYKVQGTWELAFIQWLDDNDISFRCHKGRIPYLLNGVQKNYYPDFWVDKWDSYVDVKCRYFYNEEKFQAIRDSNPKMGLRVLFKDDLVKLGVRL